MTQMSGGQPEAPPATEEYLREEATKFLGSIKLHSPTDCSRWMPEVFPGAVHISWP